MGPIVTNGATGGARTPSARLGSNLIALRARHGTAWHSTLSAERSALGDPSREIAQRSALSAQRYPSYGVGGGPAGGVPAPAPAPPPVIGVPSPPPGPM